MVRYSNVRLIIKKINCLQSMYKKTEKRVEKAQVSDNLLKESV